MSNVFLCSAKRTPIGSFLGSLSSCSASDLGAQVVRGVLVESGVDASTIDEVILGCVLTAGVGQAPARQAAIRGGLPNSVQAMTINKVCSSGLKAVMLAAQSVASGSAQAIIAGGMESMSNAPFLLNDMRIGARLGNSEAVDSVVADGLWDVYNDYHMGNCAELCAKEYKISREEQDSFAIESYRRATEALQKGYFTEEILPVTISSRKGDTLVSEDEEPAKGNPEKIPGLRAVFQKDGTVTAANASSINDGASAMLVCSEEYVKQHSLTPLARVVSQGWNAQEPEWFTTAPVGAVQHAASQAGKSIEEIDLFEINEAFSVVALAVMRDLGITDEKVNVHGGAVALGHPIGASGARILTTLLYALKRHTKKTGAVGICNGGGEATAMVLERV